MHTMTSRLAAPERLVWVLLLVGSILQQPGRTTFDTKFDLTENPGGLLGRSLHLWNPEASFGELQNQAYGYLFPQGLWFLGADALHVPDWVAQRLWSALLLIVAFEGTRLLARALDLGRVPAVVAGLAYALAPRLLGAAGVLSGEILPSVWLPWSVLPLLLVVRGRWSPRAGGLAAGVAVLMMSGVNAVGTLAMLPAGLVVVLAHLRVPVGKRLLGWWCLGVALASAWWLVPLLLLGRYSPPFLDFIETSVATTSSTGWANSVRGTDHWLAWATLGDRAWWPGAHEVASTPLLIAVGALVSALGLLGLCHPRMPLRGPLLVIALLGLVCLTAGSAATGGSLVDPWVRDLLDGPLAPLRNVHKVDPLVRLPLALGLGHLVGRLAPAAHRHLSRRRAVDVVLVRRTVAAGVATLVLVGAAPLFNGHLRMAGWDRVPHAWDDAAAWLADEPGSRALVVPGSGFGMQSWGWTIDEPLQALAAAPWVTRSQVPLVPGPTARILDAIERRLAGGRGSPGLAAFLARAGVTHVVLRRDLDVVNADTVPVARVEAALAGSPGINSVASFGSTPWGQAMVEVYALELSASRVSVVPTTSVRELNGSPGDLLNAADAGLLDGDDPVVVTGDPARPAPLVGDGQVRVERQFGRVHDALGEAMAADAEFRDDRPHSDFPGVEGVEATVADAPGGVRISASTSAGHADVIGPVRPELGPAAAYDGSALSGWRSASFTTPVGQRLTVHAPGGLAAGVALVRFDLDEALVRVTRVSVDIGDGPRTFEVPSTGVLAVPLERSGVTELAVEVLDVTDGDPVIGTVGVTELELPGAQPGRTRLVPGQLPADGDLVLQAQPTRRACVDNGSGAVCDSTVARPGEEHGTLDRTFTVHSTGEWRLSGTVVAVPGPASAALLAPLDGKAHVVADHVLADDPAVAGQFAFDGDPRTAWLSRPEDTSATLTWTWPATKRRTIDRIRVSAPHQSAARPLRAVLKSDAGTRTVDLNSLGTFAPLRVDGGVSIVFQRDPDGPGASLPMGVAEVTLDGLDSLRHAPDRGARTGASCGLGPDVVVDGEVHRTRVDGTIADLLRGSTLRWRACGPGVDLTAGEHRIRVDSTLQFEPVTLGLLARHRPLVDRDRRSLTIERWGATRRDFRVGPGVESVLRVAENLNPGWQATLDGEPLDTVALDGWQQGYVVPAGDGGRVRLEFAPDPVYRAGLLGGLLFAVLLVVAAAASRWRERRHPGTPTQPLRRSGQAVLSRGPAVVAGVVLGVVGGPFVAAGWLAVLAARRRTRVAWVGTALAAAAGIVAAWFSGDPSGQPGVAANGMVALGVGLLFGSVAVPTLPDTWRWRLPHPDRITKVALVLVVGQAVFRSVLAAGSWFWQDDFLHLALADRSGLSQEFLVRDYSGHLEVGQYFLSWLLGTPSTDFTHAAIFLVASQAVASLLLWSVLRALFPPSWWLLVPFAAYLFTPLGLVTGAWWAAGMQAFPLQITMLATLLCLIHLHRGGPAARWWGLGSLAAHAGGLVFWEKALLILPAVAAAYVLVVLADLPIRQRIRVVARHWRWGAAHGVLVAAYLAIYLRLTSSSTLTGERTMSLTELGRVTLSQMTVPGLFGGPWQSRGAENTLMPDTTLPVMVGAAVLLGLVVVASVRVRGAAAFAGWFLAAGCLVADITLLALGRGEYLGLVARDPRYVTDALPMVVIGVCAAFAPSAARTLRTVRTARTPGTGVRRPLAAVGLVVASAMITNVLLVPIVQRDAGEHYVAEVLSAVTDHPDATVFTVPVSEQVSASTGVTDLLLAVGASRGLAQPGTSAVILDGRGRPREVALRDRTDTAGEGCVWALDDEPTELLEGAPDGEADQGLRLRLLVSEPVVLHVRTGSLDQALALRPGLAEAWFAVPARTLADGSVESWVTAWPGAQDRTPARQCATEVAMGVPWPVE